MMPASFRSLDGQILQFDLDAVVDVVNGWSELKPNWQGFIVYLPSQRRFVELLSTMSDVRGNSQDEAIEVDAAYVKSAYGLTDLQIFSIRRDPSEWKFQKTR